VFSREDSRPCFVGTRPSSLPLRKARPLKLRTLSDALTACADLALTEGLVKIYKWKKVRKQEASRPNPCVRRRERFALGQHDLI